MSVHQIPGVCQPDFNAANLVAHFNKYVSVSDRIVSKNSLRVPCEPIYTNSA